MNRMQKHSSIVLVIPLGHSRITVNVIERRELLKVHLCLKHFASTKLDLRHGRIINEYTPEVMVGIYDEQKKFTYM